MAGRSEIMAGRAYVELFVKNSLFMKGMASAKKSFADFGGSLVRFGGMMAASASAILAPIAGLIGYYASAGSELNDLSAKTGISASALGELKFAAEQTGTSLDDVGTSTKKMQKLLAEAADGSKEANAKLAGLGLTLDDFKGKTVDQQFQKMADTIAAIESPAQRTAAAMELWGKSGTNLLPMVDDLARLRKEARDLNLVPTDKAVQDADELGDLFDKITSIGKAAAFSIGAALAPVLLPALEIVKNISAATAGWIKENGGLIRSVAMIGAGILGPMLIVGTVIAGVGAGFVALGAVIGGIMTTVTAFAAVLASPIVIAVVQVGALVAAIAAAGYAFVRFTSAGKAAWGAILTGLAPIIDFVRDIGSTFATTFGGILDALMGGNLALAAQIGWLGVQVVFEKFRLEAMKGWFALAETMQSAWGEVTLRIQTGIAYIGKLFTGLLDQLVPGWRSGMNLIGAAFTAGWKTFQTTAQVALGVVQVAVNSLITRLKIVLSALQAGVKASVELAPRALDIAGAAGNEGAKELIGLDLKKLFADAADEADEVNKAGREKLDAAKEARRLADEEALDAHKVLIAAKEVELAKLAAEAKAAREAGGKEPDLILKGKGAGGDMLGGMNAPSSFVTFSAAALSAVGSGGMQNKMVQTLIETKKERKEQYEKEMEIRREMRRDLKALKMVARD